MDYLNTGRAASLTPVRLPYHRLESTFHVESLGKSWELRHRYLDSAAGVPAINIVRRELKEEGTHWWACRAYPLHCKHCARRPGSGDPSEGGLRVEAKSICWCSRPENARTTSVTRCGRVPEDVEQKSMHDTKF